MKQRTSSRSVKLSKAFRTVDDETRRAITDQRLVALEHDNYNENEIIGDAATDDNYISDVGYFTQDILLRFTVIVPF